MRNIRKTLISIAFFLFFFSLFSKVFAATPISSCTVINSPGEYYLTQNISSLTASTCIDIQADNVVLDCQGRRISGNGGNYGIYVYRSSEKNTNITIRNCEITGWYYGVYFQFADSNKLSNIVANSNYYGIRFDFSNYNTLSNITANFNQEGIHFLSSVYNTLSNITTNYNGFAGIYLDQSSYNTYSNVVSNNDYNGVVISYGAANIIKDSKIQDSSNCGISINGIENKIYNNIFNNTNNFCLSTTYTNYWNTTLRAGANIWNYSLPIGGNLWTTPGNKGYSDTCNDTNSDGFCDVPYTLGTNNIDYLPIAKYVGQVFLPPSISVVFNYNSVDFGTVTPNTIAEAKSINYNVSITTNADYKVSVNATNWSGPTTIPANTIYFAVNDTLDKLNFATAKQLSNSLQQVAVFPSSVTTNYHAFYFNVPVVPIGTYTATITITYEVA